MKTLKRKRGRPRKNVQGSELGHGDGDQTSKYTTNSDTPIMVFEKARATLSSMMVKLLPSSTIETIQDAINNDSIHVNQSPDGISLTGAWQYLLEAEAALQKLGLEEKLKREHTDDDKYAVTVKTTVNKTSASQKHPEELTRNKLEGSPRIGKSGKHSSVSTDPDSIFPSVQVQTPRKTYGNSPTSADGVNTSSRRSRRLSNKPRLSFVKLAKIGVNDERDEELEPSESNEDELHAAHDDEDVTADGDDFPATITDPPERASSEASGRRVVSLVSEQDDDRLIEKRASANDVPRKIESSDSDHLTKEMVDKTENFVPSTVLIVKTSRTKGDLEVDEDQMKSFDQPDVNPKIEILQVVMAESLQEHNSLASDQTAGTSTASQGNSKIPHTRYAAITRHKYRRRPGTRRKVPPAASTVCPMCGYQSRSVVGMKSHLLNYHNPTEYECDICFKRFGQKNQLIKHRKFHFDGDGSLTESAILIHITALEREGREENLDLELLRYVNAYREKLTVQKSNTQADTSIETTEEEGITNPEQTIDPAKVSTNPDDKMLTCTMCNMKISSEVLLSKHLVSVHGVQKKKTPSVATQLGKQGDDKERHTCPHCDFVCYRIQNFTRHLRGHEKPEFYKCDMCEYTHKNKGEVARHKRNAHAEKNHQCTHCGSLHRNEVLLRTHIKMKHEWGLSVMCEICGKVLKTRFSYKKHKEVFHGNPTRKPGKVLCNLCGRTLASQKTYELHMEKCHSGSDVTLEERAIAEGFIFNPSGKSSCKFCKYQNVNPREVRRHILRLHVQKTFKCGHCDSAFLRESELLKHTRVYHMELEKRKCDLCNKTFLNDRYYQAHYNRIHTENKQFECSFCKRQFYDKRSFIQHSELHKPEEERTWKYHCEQCQRRFRFKSNYDNHMLEHTGYRPFPCQICHKAFKTKNILDRHLVTHSDERPYACKICQKTFKLKKYLDIHLLSHTSDKFVCVFCGRIFVKEEALNKHICRNVAGKDGRPLRQELLEAAETASEDLTEQNSAMDIEGMTVNIQTEKFVCTNCGECFSEESEVTDHQCTLTAKIVALKDESGNTNFYCLTCGTEFDTEEESNQHVCQIVTVEPGMHSQVFSGANVLESMLSEGGTTTIVVEQAGDHPPLETFEEVSTPPGENVQVMLEGEELQAAIRQDGGLETVATTAGALVDMLSGDVVGHGQYEQEHVEQQVVQGEEMEVQGAEEGAAPAMEVYMCGICELIFQTADDINLHMQLHAEPAEVMAGGDVLEAQAVETDVATTEDHMMAVVMGDGLVVEETSEMQHSVDDNVSDIGEM